MRLDNGAERTLGFGDLNASEPTVDSGPHALAPPSTSTGAVVPLFTATIFVGASLLFLVQPMFGKLVLPRLGGTPAVWNTCVVFFQATLLAGYLYAHFSIRWLGLARQTLLHVLVLLVPLLTLPLSAGGSQPSPAESPVWWLLRTLTAQIGLAFFVISTTSPLLQRWFAALPVASARDPYFLYAASNLGSMLALLGYPFLLEPMIGTRAQTWWWSAGYVLFLVLTLGCLYMVRSRALTPGDQSQSNLAGTSPTHRMRLQWLVLSLVPSSLMLGVTTHVSTDVAPVPLLWVLPLAIYLGTFVLVFSSREWLSTRWLSRVFPFLIYGSIVTIFMNARGWTLIPLHLATFFVAAMICHGELARRRPPARDLTEFYIWMSAGGVLGGVFNSLIAPHVFTLVLEYPLALAVAAFLRPSPHYRASHQESLGFIAALSALILVLAMGVWASGGIPGIALGRILIACGAVLAVGYMFANRTALFGVMALGSAGLLAFAGPSGSGRVLFADRSFFGVHRVIESADRTHHLLQHGSTVHGRQELSSRDRCEPTGYYHRANPIGQLFQRSKRFERVAVTGLGTGGLACYAEAGALWTFYEIDPMVEQVARDPRYFTFLEKSPGRISVVLGDGRLTLAAAPNEAYDLVVLDAFSSDGIPAHLLTREALQLYLSKLRPHGVIAVHISNRYLHLEPLIAALTQEAGLVAIANDDIHIDTAALRSGRLASHWVMASRTEEALSGLTRQPGWRPPIASASVGPWTDDYSNILQVLARR